MLENSNFSFFINYDTRENYSCEYSGCHEEGVCRCSIIEEVIIKNVDINELSEEIFDRLDQDVLSSRRNKKLTELLWDYDYDVVNQYCINRILTINRLWESDSWCPKISMSYYGEEVEDIVIEENIFNKISSQILEVLNILSLEEKVFYILKLEYGNVLENILDKKMSIQDVSFNKIEFPQKSHLNSVKSKDLNFYKNFDFIRGIVRSNRDRYQVIDGYHRLSANTDEKVTVIVVN